MIEPMEEPSPSEIDGREFESDAEESGNAEDIMAVTVHALVSYSNTQTIRFSGYLKCQPITISIDTSSTNNFLDEGVSKRLSIPVDPCDQLKEKLADRITLTCQGKYSRVKPLLLGIEWLRTLEDVLWNFLKLTIKFTLNGQRVTFRGKHRGNITTISSHQMEQVLKNERS